MPQDGIRLDAYKNMLKKGEWGAELPHFDIIVPKFQIKKKVEKR
jgi:hypothetical protein